MTKHQFARRAFLESLPGYISRFIDFITAGWYTHNMRLTYVFNKIRLLKYAALGGLLGFLVLHPYTMLAYYLHDSHGGAERSLPELTALFKPEMLHMGLPYLLLGAAAGLFFGLWLEAERRRDEMEKKAYALDTLKQLMVTLSHYLLNASTSIGGFAGLAIKKESDPDQVKRIEVIKTESERIEAVVGSLQSLKDITSENYGTDNETLMLDIKNQIEQHLKESNKDIAYKEKAA